MVFTTGCNEGENFPKAMLMDVYDRIQSVSAYLSLFRSFMEELLFLLVHKLWLLLLHVHVVVN